MKKLLLILVAVFSLSVSIAFASQDKINLAVLDFDSADIKLSSLNEKITPLLTELLSNVSYLQIVERKRLDDLINEIQLGKAGIMDNSTAAKVGKLAGAHAVIIGKIFLLDDELIITSKIINIENGIVFSNVVRGNSSSKISNLITQLADKIKHTFEKEKNSFVVLPEIKDDKIALIKDMIEGQTLPVLSIGVAERHIGEMAIDPACEMELKYYFTNTGFKVIDNKNKEFRAWVNMFAEEGFTPLPGKMGEVDVLIVGEAFSEFGLRKGNLVSCKARIEIQAIEPKSGQVLIADRITETAVDISTQIAGKTALQEGAAKLAERLIPKLVKRWETFKNEKK